MPPTRARIMKRSPVRCGIFLRNAGCARARTYHDVNPKRVYYLSMEFLIGRSLANNVTNLLLDPLLENVIDQKNVDWLALVEKEPDAGLGNGGLGRLAACFLDSLATMQIPAMGYGLRYEYGMFKQTIQNGWQHEMPDNWLRYPDPWEVARPYVRVTIPLNCSFILRDGALRAIAGRDSSLYGIPFDRPVVGYGGKNINTLRLWAASAPDYFDFQQFSSGDFVGALAETLAARIHYTRVVPRRFDGHGPGAAFRAGIFSGGVFAGGHRSAFSPQECGLERIPGKNGDSAERYTSDNGSRGVDAHPAR